MQVVVCWELFEWSKVFLNVIVRLLVKAMIGYISQLLKCEMLQFSLPNLGRGCGWVATRGARLDHLHSSHLMFVLWEEKKIHQIWLENGWIKGSFCESVDPWLSFPSNLAGHVTWLGAHHPGQPPHCLLLSRQAGFNKKSDRTDLTGGWSISAPKEWEMSHVVVQKEIYQQWNLPQQLELNTLQYIHDKRKNIQQ